MVKKTRKEEKNTARDQFDPILVEASQAATVVLMLESPEEEILLQSTQAIYKFVEKCDSNKLLLFDLGAVPLLLKLAQSESRPVSRNACMALGSMSRLPAVVSDLKKSDEIIPSMIRLLYPDGEAALLEYAVLCLLNLAKRSFASICRIRELNGLEPLIRCLSAADQDVKNNAIEIIVLMLEDYQTRTMIRELNGLPPIIELLKSEYPEIQFKALVALLKITEEAISRTILRDLGAMNKLVEFIGTPTYSDLHVLAVHVLSNCFEDADTIKALKENGLLSRLISIACDEPLFPLPKPDEKKKKSDGGSAKSSRKGRLSGEKVKAKSLEISVTTPSSPEVKEQIVLAFRRAAKNTEIRNLLPEVKVEKMLVQFLNHPDMRVQVASSQAVIVVAENLLSRETIGKLDGIHPLVNMISSEQGDIREPAVTALHILTTTSDFNCIGVLQSGGIVPLLKLLSSCSEVAISGALGTLVNMAKEDKLRDEVLDSGFITAVIQPLTSKIHKVQSKAALAVATLITERHHRQQFVEANGVQPLVSMLESTDEEVRQTATKAISVLARDVPTAEEISRLGGLDILLKFQKAENARWTCTDEAIGKILENNLSAKYALTGKLNSEDKIVDGFYDVGRINPGSQFFTLAEYNLQPLNGNRPILLIRAANESEGSRNSSARELYEGLGNITAASGCLTRSPTLSSARFTPRTDIHFADYVKEIDELLLPFSFCSLRERGALLARFVAEKMGGPVEKGHLIHFSHDLPNSKLKYDLNSNVIPIGLIAKGIHYHRALLFKALGDRAGIPSSLVRGENNFAWNELSIEERPTVHPKTYIMDLIYEPGQLILANSPEAVMYTKP